MAGTNDGWGAADPIQREQQQRDLSDALDWRCLQWKDGCMYQGLEAGGALESHGVVSWPARRERYEGQLWRSAPHGAGVYRWRDGTLYRGEWYDGHMHGCGVLIWMDEHGDIQAQAGKFFDDEYVGPVGSCSSAAAHEAALEADVAAARARTFETTLGRQQRGAGAGQPASSSTSSWSGNAALPGSSLAAGSNSKGTAAGRGAGGSWWPWLPRGSPPAGTRPAGVPAGASGATPAAVTGSSAEDGRWLWAARAHRLGNGGARGGAGGVQSAFTEGIGPGAASGGRLGVVAAPYGTGASGASGSKSSSSGSGSSGGGSGGGLRWGSIARWQQQQQRQLLTVPAGQGLGDRHSGVALAGGAGNTQAQGQAQGQGQQLLPEQQRQLEALLAGSILSGLVGQGGSPPGRRGDRG